MLKRTLILAAGVFALAAFALSPQAATAASWAGGAAAPQAAEADLSNVIDVHRRGRHWRRHIWWGAPFAVAPFATGPMAVRAGTISTTARTSAVAATPAGVTPAGSLRGESK